MQLWWIEKQKAVAHTAMKLMQSNVQDYSIPEQGKPGWSQWVSKNFWLTLMKSCSIWEASSANMLQSSEGEQQENRDILMYSWLALRAYIHSVLDAEGLGQVFSRIRPIMRDSLNIGEPNSSLSSSSYLRNSF